MTPEDIKDLKIILATWKFEITEIIEDKFKQIITNNKERWKDEDTRRRESVRGKMTEAHEVIEFELSKELKEKLRGVFYDTDSNVLNVYIKSEESKSSPIRCNVDKSSMRNTIEQFDADSKRNT